MGQSKREWEDYNDGGWSTLDKVVCPDCVEDEYLKNLIRSNASLCVCDYCGTRTRSRSAASVEVVMPAVASALNYLYAEPTAAGVPYDGGWVFEPTDTADALMGVPFECHDDLFEDVANSFSNTAWILAADGHWASSHRNEEWSSAWQAFAEKVKHQSRYFFTSSSGDAEDGFGNTPLEVLELVGEMAVQLGLLVTLPVGLKLFRVRERVGDADWSICAEQLAAPPNDLAHAGRMNPAGISYLYLAKTQKGALAEVLRGPPCHAVVAQFEANCSLSVMDLNRLPDLPSLFDDAQRREREAVLFLSDFVADICKPVQKDGREHISYVPSQIVSEYFAKVFRTPEGDRLDGIVYPSAVSPGSVNVALFPQDNQSPFAHAVTFKRGDEVSLETWADFSNAIS